MLTNSRDLRLIGCGVDGETISRFLPHVAQPEPLPLVFSAEEVHYINSLAEPALGFCAAFCCKEALFKAIGRPINFVECQFFYHPELEIQRPRLLLRDSDLPEIGDCSVRILLQHPDELVAIVHIYSRIPR